MKIFIFITHLIIIKMDPITHLKYQKLIGQVHTLNIYIYIYTPTCASLYAYRFIVLIHRITHNKIDHIYDYRYILKSEIKTILVGRRGEKKQRKD